MLIELQNGGYAEVSEEDAHLALTTWWRTIANGTPKAIHREWLKYGQVELVFLHRSVFPCTGKQVRPRDGNYLNCTRENLVVSSGQSVHRPASGRVGVRLLKSGQYKAHIRVDGKRETIGYYDTFEEAADARARREQELGYDCSRVVQGVPQYTRTDSGDGEH